MKARRKSPFARARLVKIMGPLCPMSSEGNICVANALNS